MTPKRKIVDTPELKLWWLVFMFGLTNFAVFLWRWVPSGGEFEVVRTISYGASTLALIVAPIIGIRRLVKAQWSRPTGSEARPLAGEPDPYEGR